MYARVLKIKEPLIKGLMGLCWMGIWGAVACFAEPQIQQFSQGDVAGQVQIDPPEVHPLRSVEVTLQLTYPQTHQVELSSDVATRFEGFVLKGEYTVEPDSKTASRAQTWVYNLQPIPGATRYRVRPIAITVKDSTHYPATNFWFTTPLIALDAVPLSAAAPVPVESHLVPHRIPYSIRGILRGVGYGIGGLLVLGLLVLLLRRLLHIRKLHRMTPRERAFRELSLLLGRHLPEKGLFKDFYVELTLVVRRYIERRHGIRAPEQTTEEFLLAATQHASFEVGRLETLRAFLTAADLVKFSGLTATVEMTATAVEKAKAYLVQEAELSASEMKGKGRRS